MVCHGSPNVNYINSNFALYFAYWSPNQYASPGTFMLFGLVEGRVS